MYTLRLTDASGPGPSDKSSVAWLYESSEDVALGGARRGYDGGAAAAAARGFAGADAGLFGALVVSARARDGAHAPPRFDGAPSDVNREFVVFASALDENASPYLPLNVARFARGAESVNYDDPLFRESNRMRSLNGYMYCNAPGLALLEGRVARWYVLSTGTSLAADRGVHAPRWYGHALETADAVAAGSLLVQPRTAHVADMYATNRGTWLMACQVGSHAHAGMQALYTVEQRVTSSCAHTFWAKC